MTREQYQRVVWLAPHAAFDLADKKFGEGQGKTQLLRYAAHDQIAYRQALVRVECSDVWYTSKSISGDVYAYVLLDLLLDRERDPNKRELVDSA